MATSLAAPPAAPPTTPADSAVSATPGRHETIRLLRGSTLLMGGSIVGGLLGVAYTFLMARSLDAPDYATLVALLSLLTIVSLPSSTIQVVVARSVAQAEGAGRYALTGEIVLGLLRRVLPVAVVTTVAVAAAAEPLAAFLQVGAPDALFFMAPLLGLALLLPALRGALQGMQRFGVLAALALLDTLFKVALGALLVWAGFGVAGAVGAMLVGTLAGLGFSWLGIPATTRAAWRGAY
jgi:O-antigen/teichoic acid export membrane protein